MDAPAAPARAIVAGLLIALGLLLNPWLVGYVASDDRSIRPLLQFAAVLMVSVAALLGGAQLRWRWVERLSWTGQVGRLRAAAVVGLVAFLIAGTYWRIASYKQAHSHTTVVSTEHAHATPEQQQWADNFYQRALAAALKHGWFDINNAFAQGFQVDRVNHSHFPNLQYMFDDVILDPERPEWLIYEDSPDGKVLMGFMFFTRSLEEVGPTPAGPLALWHYHPYDRPRCAVNGLWTVARVDANGNCAEGIPVNRTPEMFHVWFMDHPLGRFTEMDMVVAYGQENRFDPGRLHPVMVHFAIALFMIAVLLDVTAVVTSRRDFHRAAWLNLVVAAVAAVAAVASGMTAETGLKPTHAAHQTLDLHKLLAFASLGGILLLFAWRYVLRGQFPQRGVVLYLAVSLASAGAIGGAGYYGGEMVYRHGAGVRMIDLFSRDSYWKRVREVYRYAPAGVAEPGLPKSQPAHAGH
jgi:uncharacterized membrane protein